MFDLPQAKRISRTELFTDATELEKVLPQPDVTDPTTAEEDVEPYSLQYDIKSPPNAPPSGVTHNTADTGSFAFRLFAHTSQTAKTNVVSTAAATTVNTAPPVTTIILRSRSSSPRSREGYFVDPKRPQSYYFTSLANGLELSRQKAQFASAAVTNQALLDSARKPWPGTHLPWRVIHLLRSRVQFRNAALLSQSQPKENPHSKPKENPPPHHKPTKPGKKRRILLRKRHAKLQATKQTQADLELADRVKRAARNREKKFKKRARDKAKKAAISTTGTVGSDITVESEPGE